MRSNTAPMAMNLTTRQKRKRATHAGLEVDAGIVSSGEARVPGIDE